MMSSVIRSIALGKQDEEIHREFLKYSKGLFKGKYAVDAKRGKEGWSIKTGPEFANFLVRSFLEGVQGKLSVKGAVIATFDVSKEARFPVLGIKQFMGIKQAQVDGEIEMSSVLDLMNRFPRAFFALSFITPKGSLKIKPKAPKSAKPAAAGEKEKKAEFCSIKTADKEIIGDLLFDCLDAMHVSISHEIVIESIILPVGVSDPVQIREQSVRSGTIIRKVVADGVEKKTEFLFRA